MTSDRNAPQPDRLAVAAIASVAALFCGIWLMLAQWPTRTVVESVSFASPSEAEGASGALGDGNDVYLAALGLTVAITATVALVTIAIRAARSSRQDA